MTSRQNLQATRLRHDLLAHIRAIQISSRKLFVYCEGRTTDPYIYSELVRRIRPDDERYFTIYRAEEVIGTGGKDSLLKLYKNFKKKQLLVSEFKGKKFCCILFLDKDVDDISNRKGRSDHLFYTELYDLEGQVYRDSDLRRAISIGLSIDMDSVPSDYHDSRVWIERKSIEWEHWLVLCVYSAVYDVDCGCGFGRPSSINCRTTGGVNLAAYANFRSDLKTKSGVPAVEFEKRFLRIEKKIHRLKSKKSLSVVFKGKWIEAIIVDEIRKKFAGKPVNLDNFGSRMTGAAVACFDFSSKWCKAHIQRIESILANVD